MGLPITLSEIAPRISAGAFILNSGLNKRGADEEADTVVRARKRKREKRAPAAAEVAPTA